MYNAYIKVVSDSIRQGTGSLQESYGISIIRGVALRGIQTDMFGHITAGLDQAVSAYALFAWQAKYGPPGEEDDSEDFSPLDAISWTFLYAVNMSLLSGRHKMHPVYNGVHSIIQGALLYRGGKNRCILVSVYVLSRFGFLVSIVY